MDLVDSPIIQTERLLVRNLDISYIKNVFSYRSLPSVAKFQSFKPKNLADMEVFFSKLAPSFNRSNTWFQLGVHLLHNHQLIGDIGLHFLEGNDQIEIGFTIDPKFQRKGYAQEAVSAVIRLIFNDYGKHRIIASVDPQNQKSINLLEKLGFKREGCFRKSVFIDGQWVDDCIYAILREEWNR